MKVTFLKDHGAYKAGDTYDLPDPSANYMIRCSVAVAGKEKVEKSIGPEKVSVPGPAPKKEIAPGKEKIKKAAGKEKVEK